MELSLHVATAAQKNLREQLNVVANNIANSQTVGFRAEIVDFKSLVSQSAENGVHFPDVANLQPSIMQGALSETGNPLDIAITGDGWFAIDTPAGTAYTRDGRFMMTNLGELQTLEGYQVLDAGGAPIQVENATQAPEILQDGRILSNGNLVGNIGIYQIDPENFISRFSNSAFVASVPGVPIEIGDATLLNQGYIEGSNVSAVHELTNLIAISKSYESVSNLIGKVDDALSRSVRELGGTR